VNTIEPVLSIRGASKRFGGTTALENVDLTLYKGEVLGLVGENGAGKSTLVKILAGTVRRDAGTIFLNGEQVDITDARQSQKHGIGVIFQELSIFPALTAAQNIFINQEARRSPFGVLKQREMNEQAQLILREELGVNIDPEAHGKDLSVGQRQSLEIARALIRKKSIIVMDEPTAALESKERECLFAVIRKLKERGTSVIFISHHLDEVMHICDRVMVLRDGKTMAEMHTRDIDVSRIIELMIGKSLQKQYPKEDIPIGDAVLEVRNLSRSGSFRNISFTLRKGEILGFAGLEGCGKNEIFRCIFGLRPYEDGEVKVLGAPMDRKGILGAMEKRIAFLPAERKTEGLFLIQDVKWNTTIASLKKVSRFKIGKRKERELFDGYVQSFRIKISRRGQVVTGLSGGNQQKVMLARWLMTEPDIIFMEEPTRGIDVSAKTEVYRSITECAKAGKSVCIISPEGPELLGMCDRIVVITEGEISKVLDPRTTSEQELAYYITKSKEGANLG
jgi:ribose transport system ATP-binding protein